MYWVYNNDGLLVFLLAAALLAGTGQHVLSLIRAAMPKQRKRDAAGAGVASLHSMLNRTKEELGAPSGRYHERPNFPEKRKRPPPAPGPNLPGKAQEQGRPPAPQSIMSQMKSVSGVEWMRGRADVADVCLCAFVRLRDEQGRFALAGDTAPPGTMAPIGSTPVDKLCCRKLCAAAARLAQENGVEAGDADDLATDVDGYVRIALPSRLRVKHWEDLVVLDPWLELLRRRRPSDVSPVDTVKSQLQLLLGDLVGEPIAADADGAGFACAIVPHPTHRKSFRVWIAQVSTVQLSSGLFDQLTR